ncbi:MAG: AmmeMemoRadiSam system protein B, partial [Sphaerochaetaceae bacterium]
MMNTMRDAQYAGSWYPKDPESLRLLVEGSVAQSKGREMVQSGPYRFAVLPHAGLFYSNEGIAPFFTTGLGSIERILVISPSHYVRLPVDSLVSARFSGYRTPLGNLKAFTLECAQSRWCSAIQNEHALEMVLPYIAAQNAEVKVSLALLSHFSDPEAIRKVAERLFEDLGREQLETGRTAIIASSDFTHYGPRFGYVPYGSRAVGMVREDDLGLARLLSEGKVNEAFSFCMERHTTVCGYAAALLVSFIAHKLHCYGWVANYYTSLDVSPSNDANFVAYSTIL